jgi:hypothetical protein
MKKLMNLKDVRALNKKQQLSISGGRMKCLINGVCIDYGRQCAELICTLLPYDC